jgi:hypothetical protein
LATRGLHEAIASKRADIHLRIRTLIGAAGCLLVRGPREAIGSNQTPTHSLPPSLSLSWIMAPSELPPCHSTLSATSVALVFFFRIPASRTAQTCVRVPDAGAECQCTPRLLLLIALDTQLLLHRRSCNGSGANREDSDLLAAGGFHCLPGALGSVSTAALGPHGASRWCELRRPPVCSVARGWRGHLERQRQRRLRSRNLRQFGFTR